MAPPILIVDDNKVNLFAMRVLIERLGLPVELAESGQRAVELTTDRAFAAILLDLLMPNLDGYKTAEALRKAGVTAPIIAVTALDDSQELRARCRKAGIDDVITKPIDSRMLAEKLARNTALRPPGKSITPSLLQAIYGDRDLPAILTAFLEVTRELMEQLEQSLQAHASDEARRALHELKSATSQLYVGEIAHLCREIELARQKDDWPKMVALYTTLNEAFAKIVAVLGARSDEKRMHAAPP